MGSELDPVFLWLGMIDESLRCLDLLRSWRLRQFCIRTRFDEVRSDQVLAKLPYEFFIRQMRCCRALRLALDKQGDGIIHAFAEVAKRCVFGKGKDVVVDGEHHTCVHRRKATTKSCKHPTGLGLGYWCSFYKIIDGGLECLISITVVDQ